MISKLNRLADRVLARLAPEAAASASNTDKCYCQCSDVCFYCCPTSDGLARCAVASGSQCM